MKAADIMTTEVLMINSSATVAQAIALMQTKKQPIESLLISKTSETGKFILSLWSEHEDFATKYQNDVADSVPEEESESAMSAGELVEPSYDTPF